MPVGFTLGFHRSRLLLDVRRILTPVGANTLCGSGARERLVLSVGPPHVDPWVTFVDHPGAFESVNETGGLKWSMKTPRDYFVIPGGFKEV